MGRLGSDYLKEVVQPGTASNSTGSLKSGEAVGGTEHHLCGIPGRNVQSG